MNEKPENAPFHACQVAKRAKLGKTIISQSVGKACMNPQDKSARAYVLVEIQPGKEKEFKDDILSRNLLADSKEERIDFVHGAFDFVVILCGEVKDIDRRIIEIRKSPFVVKTETLI